MPPFYQISAYAFVCIYFHCNITNWTFVSKLESHWWEWDVVFNLLMTNNKQRLDEVFVIYRIIKVISRSQRLSQIILTETLIILDISETKANDCFIIPWTKRKICFCLASNTKCACLTWFPLEIMHRGHTWHDCLWPWVTLTWYWIICTWMTSQALMRKFTVRFRPIRKEIVSWINNDLIYLSGLHGDQQISIYSTLFIIGTENEEEDSSCRILDISALHLQVIIINFFVSINY